MEDRILKQLRDLFVGKKVKITYQWGQYYKGIRTEFGVCKAVHSVPISNAPFDIEIVGGNRYGVNPEKVTDKFCEGFFSPFRFRKVEVVED